MARPKNITPSVKVTQSKAGVWSCYWQDFSDRQDGASRMRGCHFSGGRPADRDATLRRMGEPDSASRVYDWAVDRRLHRRSDEATTSPTFLANLKQPRVFFANYTAAMLTPAAWQAYRAWRGAMHVDNAGSRAAKMRTPKPIKDFDHQTRTERASRCHHLGA